MANRYFQKHSSLCDINPKTLTWRRKIPKGEIAYVCGECRDKAWAKPDPANQPEDFLSRFLLVKRPIIKFCNQLSDELTSEVVKELGVTLSSALYSCDVDFELSIDWQAESFSG